MNGDRTGVILARAAYMSPEQANGRRLISDTTSGLRRRAVRDVDPAATFQGETIQETVAAVLKWSQIWVGSSPSAPAITTLSSQGPQVPATGHRDVMPLLEEPLPSEMLRRRRSTLLWPGVAALLAIVAVVAWWAPSRTSTMPEITRFQIAPPEKHFGSYLNVSADGRKLVFAGQGQMATPAFGFET